MVVQPVLTVASMEVMSLLALLSLVRYVLSYGLKRLMILIMHVQFFEQRGYPAV